MFETWTREDVSVFLGYLSIACWIPVTIPELLEIWRLKSADAISLPFIVLWALGDVCNLLGCILTGQLSTQTYLATWYVCSDVMMISMCIYFDVFYVKPAKGTEREPLRAGQRLQMSLLGVAVVYVLAILQSSSPIQSPAALAAHAEHSRMLLSSSEVGNSASSANIVGQVVAWTSTCLYLVAKIPQVHRNYVRKSTEGLAAKMFILCICANLSYVGSILVHATTREDIEHSLPYIVGGFTAPFDLTILFQIWYYNRYFTAYKEFDEIPYEGHLASHSDQALRRASTTPLPTELPFYYSMPVIRSVRGGGLHHVYNALTHSLSPINEHEAAHAAALRRRASL